MCEIQSKYYRGILQRKKAISFDEDIYSILLLNTLDINNNKYLKSCFKLFTFRTLKNKNLYLAVNISFIFLN